MKRFFVFFLAVLLTVVLCLQVSAFEYPDLWFFEDGKMVYEAEDESISIWLLERTETSPAVSIVDEKITKYYRAFNANKEILWEVSLSASCEISSHRKIKCQFSVDRDIYDNHWTVDELVVVPSKSGNSGTVNAVFHKTVLMVPVDTQKFTWSVTCDYKGDVLSDQVLDMKDVLALRRYVAKKAVTIDKAQADLNRDGSIDTKDILFLRRIASGLASVPIRMI